MTQKRVQAAGRQFFIQVLAGPPSAAEISSGSRAGAAVLHFQDPAPVLLVTLLPGAPPALAWMASCPDRDQDPKAQRGNFPSLSAALFGIKFKLPLYPGTKATRLSLSWARTGQRQEPQVTSHGLSGPGTGASVSPRRGGPKCTLSRALYYQNRFR